MDPMDDTNATPQGEQNEGEVLRSVARRCGPGRSDQVAEWAGEWPRESAREGFDGDEARALDRAEEDAKRRAHGVTFDGEIAYVDVDP
jgi:hypothetical protein